VPFVPSLARSYPRRDDGTVPNHESPEPPAALVRYEVADRVATLTMDSPANRNALSRRLVTGLSEGLDRGYADPEVAVLVLRAAGPVFCSGADLTEAVADGMEVTTRTLVALQRQVVAGPKPVVAAVQGPARAGGIGLVAACDVAVASVDATFALTEVRLGLAPAAISLTVLPRMTSRAAAWACLGGEAFDGAAAQQAGLVTLAVPAASLEDAVGEVCAALAKGRAQGMRETKGLLAAPLLAHIDAHGEEVAALSARLFGSHDARQAMQAFLTRGR
jgi:enoyl-CoA hydratase/methylglutaconyl-CoA hydratase